jgi:hypothetical protein
MYHGPSNCNFMTVGCTIPAHRLRRGGLTPKIKGFPHAQKYPHPGILTQRTDTMRSTAPIVGYVYTLLWVLLLSYAAAVLGPSMDDPSQQLEDLQHAEQSAQDRQRYLAQAQALCGGPHATVNEVAPGVVDCFNKRGVRTMQHARVQP